MLISGPGLAKHVEGARHVVGCNHSTVSVSVKSGTVLENALHLAFSSSIRKLRTDSGLIASRHSLTCSFQGPGRQNMSKGHESQADHCQGNNSSGIDLYYTKSVSQCTFLHHKIGTLPVGVTKSSEF